MLHMLECQLARAGHGSSRAGVGDAGTGAGGGRVVAAGTPEDVARAPLSHTGRFLAQRLVV